MVLTGLLSKGSAQRAETIGRFEIPRPLIRPAIYGFLIGLVAQQVLGFILWEPLKRIPGVNALTGLPLAGLLAYPLIGAGVGVVLTALRTRSGLSAGAALVDRAKVRNNLGRLHLGICPTDPEPVLVEYMVAAVPVARARVSDGI